MICDTCLGVLQRREGLVQDDEDSLLFVHHGRASSLRQSALEGCYICQPFWNQLSHAERDALLDFNLPDHEIEDEDPDTWAVRAHQMRKHVTLCMLQRGDGIEMPSCYTLAVVLNGDIDLSRASKKETYAFGMYVFQPAAGLYTSEPYLVFR